MQASSTTSPFRKGVERPPPLRKPKIALEEAAIKEKLRQQQQEQQKAQEAPSVVLMCPREIGGSLSNILSPQSDETGSVDNDEDDAGNGNVVVLGGDDFSELRCSSVRTEEVAEALQKKAKQRQNRCPDYPGLAFGSAMFGSDTMMKFSIIKNELHNIMRSQLKRVDGEMTALAHRIKTFDESLERSEGFIKTATTILAEAVQMEFERCRSLPPLEEKSEGDESTRRCISPLTQFDSQLALLEGKMLQAKFLAEQATREDEAFSKVQPDLVQMQFHEIGVAEE